MRGTILPSSPVSRTSSEAGVPSPGEVVIPRVRYFTFGCKANQYDTERIRRELEGRGAASVESDRAADVAVINTCTVTNQADANARQLIRRLRRRHPGLRILVAGCSAALREADYRKMVEVDDVVSGHDPERVARALDGLGPLAAAEARVPEDATARWGQRRGTRAWLKVQDGCDRKCSFCATRLARGASRSRPPGAILREARALAREHPELVITGIHIGHYGRDLDPPTTLSRLCASLLEVVDARIRLSSIEATEVDALLLDILESSGGRLAPHLHMPLQSGSDRVLRLMRRWHTRAMYRDRALEIASRLPVLGLGADVIVGFPGEGATEFAETRKLIEELPYTYLHVFPFSVRDGTVAASLPDRVPGDVAAARSRELREHVLEKGRAYRARRVGGAAEVVLEGDDSGTIAGGLTGDYLRVDVRGPAGRPGDRLTTVLWGDADRLFVRVPAGSFGKA